MIADSEITKLHIIHSATSGNLVVEQGISEGVGIGRRRSFRSVVKILEVCGMRHWPLVSSTTAPYGLHLLEQMKE